MNLSIDTPSNDARNISQVLAGWLDDCIDGRCTPEDMKRAFLAVCRGHAEAPWDALALLDQYQRLGRLEKPLVRELKSEIAQLVFGPASQPGLDDSHEQDDTVDTVAPGSASSLSPTYSDASSTGDAAAPVARDATDASRPHAPGPTASSQMAQDRVPSSSQAHARPVLPPGHDTRLRPERPSAWRADTSAEPPAAIITSDKKSAQAISQEPVWARPLSTSSDDFDEPVRALHGADAVLADEVALNAAPAVDRAADQRLLNVGELLRGRYELLAVLGRGSAGIVYQAVDRHRAHLAPEARQVAIKVLATDYSRAPDSLARLEREFHQAQSLSHPNVMRVFDLDRDGDTYFIVMELLQGELLSELKAGLRGQPMQHRHALAIVSAVGAAVAHAHRRGIIHGDLKPENIMITRQGEVRVLDFGFAGAQAAELHSAAAVGAPRRTVAAYASVERANGSEPHPSDDVYSLACIAYELLSGRHPFGGRSAPLARAHGRKPRKIAGLTSRQMQVLQRALLWARGERSIDVVELLAGLGCGEAPAQLGTLEELSQPAGGDGWRRWLIAAGILLLLLLLVVAGVAAAWWLFGRDSISPTSAPVVVAPPAPPVSVQPSTVQRPPSQPEDLPSVDQGAAAAPAGSVAATSETTEQPAPAAAPASGRLPMIEFDKDTYVVSEGDGSVRLIVHRSGSVARELTFSWVLRPNSAEAGTDYADIGPGVERIPAGVREVGLTIPLVQDSMKEGTELFLAQLQVEGDMAQLGDRSSAAVIIIDDD